MLNQIKGLHHVTSMASDAQQNNQFFTHKLGLRRVKKTVNFDAPDVYHLYYADEFGTPGSRLIGPIYQWYSRNVLPRIGRALSHHDSAYSYLPESIGAFAYGDEFARILSAAGFSHVEARPLMFGAVYLYTGQKT
jgi:catechol 2,3-dioxygenase-like lactoylglutathione lyase family enzyme